MLDIGQERRKRGMTQRQLGAAAGCSGGTIKHIEGRRSQPGPDLLIRIADALGISHEKLWARYRPGESAAPRSEVKRRKHSPRRTAPASARPAGSEYGRIVRTFVIHEYRR